MSRFNFKSEIDHGEIHVMSLESFDGTFEEWVYSEEGIAGGLKAFLHQTGSTILGGVGGAVVGGVLGGAPGAAIGYFAGAHTGSYKSAKETAEKCVKLRRDIKAISERIAQLKKGELKEAKVRGLSLPQGMLTGEDADDVMEKSLIGAFVPFAIMAYGSRAEDMQAELAAKMTELKIEFARINHTVYE